MWFSVLITATVNSLLQQQIPDRRLLQRQLLYVCTCFLISFCTIVAFSFSSSSSKRCSCIRCSLSLNCSSSPGTTHTHEHWRSFPDVSRYNYKEIQSSFLKLVLYRALLRERSLMYSLSSCSVPFLTFSRRNSASFWISFAFWLMLFRPPDSPPRDSTFTCSSW